LKRLGAVTFDVLTDAEAFGAALDGLADHYDFRKAATYAITPFREDPAKRGFLTDLVRRGLLLAAVLKVDNQVCGMLTATAPSKGWSHGAGIVVHNLKFSRATPGYIIMKLFSVWLKKYPDVLYDITPGDHAYKNQHATDYDALLELRVTNLTKAIGFRSVYYAKEVAKKFFSTRQLQPSDVRMRMQRILRSLRYPTYTFNSFRSTFRPVKSTLWHLNNIGLTHRTSIRFNKDNIADLLLYDEKDGKTPGILFMRNALTLYEQGQVLYTYTQHGSLKCVVWLSLQDDNNRAVLLANQAMSVPADGLLLHGLYTFGAQTDEIAVLIQAIAQQLRLAYPSRELYIVSKSLSGTESTLLQPVETG
jgi:hypothetical protein